MLYEHAQLRLYHTTRTVIRLGLYDGDTVVAVKRTPLHPDEDEREKDLREKELFKELQHPNIARYHDYCVEGDYLFLALEPCVAFSRAGNARSCTLRRWVESPGLRAQRTDAAKVAVARGMCEGLRYLHDSAEVRKNVAERGVIHRDLKPENVMVVQTSDGREVAKVLDFGLAKLRDHTGSMTVTRTGAIVGTPYYMPPEQIRGEAVDARGDVYAIGALLYKAATGVPPYVAKTPMGVLTKHLTEELVLPSRRSGFHLPGEADAIIGRAMEKDAARRQQSADELRDELLAFLEAMGQAMSDPSLTRSSSKAAVVQTGVATRADVDKYETRIRRRGIFGYAMLALLVVGVAAGAWVSWQKYETREVIPVAESEPNDRPENADPIPAGHALEGMLGKRQSTELGDVDLYRIDNPGRERRLLELHVTGLPNIDLVVDVVRRGQSEPVLSADAAGVGGDEHIGGFPLTSPVYLIRVRERWIAGQLPTENVSDRYSIRYELRDPEPGEETEVNDSLELAGELAVGGSVTGRIGWGGDVDTYCLPGTVEASHVSVSGIEGLDLRIRTVDRVLHRSRIVDEEGIGAPEVAAITAGQGRCVEVSADPDEVGALRSEGSLTYELRHVPGPVPAGVPEAAP